MAKKIKTNITSFTIAHYILLFFVVVLCVCIIAWVMIHRNNSSPENNVSINTTHISSSNPCVQRTINTINQMWAYNPKQVPQKYWDIAMSYMNQPIITRTYGLCQDVGYVCHPGQILRDCDPCAIPSARTYAQSIHIADMIEKNCPDQN